MIVHGEGEVLVPAHLNFGKYVLDRLRQARPDEICLQNCATGDKLTYSEFVQHAVSLSAVLTQFGVGRGDTVAVAGEPCITFLPTGLAVVCAGAAYTPIELECGRTILAHKLNLTKPKYVICSRLFWEKYSDILKGLDFVNTFIGFEAIDGLELCVESMVSRQVDVATFEPAAVDGASDVAIIMYSSGTTGMSKGVLLTHLNCIARCNTQGYYDFDSLQTAYLWNEISCTYVFFATFVFICAGKKVLYSGNELDLKTLHDYQVDALPTIPTILEELLSNERKDEYDLSSLKIVYCGGGSLHVRVKKEYKQRYPNINVVDVYGATETGFIVTKQPNDTDIAAVGVAVAGVAIKVVDIETRAILGPNQRGEICVRSPSVMKGYLGAIAPFMDEQGYFLTGDLGYYNDQKRFYLVGRLKDIISYRSSKVSPEEVEAVLLQHAAVREAAVVGAPAGASGEQVAAFVVLRPGASATGAELQDYVAEQVTRHMRLNGGVRFLPELPRNPRGKVLRQQLREMLVEEV